VACTVFDNDFRHPALLAKEAATVDLLTDGRLEFAIGAGWFKPEYDRAGLPFDPPGVRVSRLEEAVRYIKGLWTHGGGPDSPGFSFAGKYYTAAELKINPPLQRPHPPILIGGGGRRMLSLAAREADTVQIISQARPEGGSFDVSTNSEAALAERVGWVRTAARERFPRLELSAAFHRVAVTDDRRAAAEQFATAGGLAAGMTPQQILDSPYFLIGSLDAIVEQLLALRERHSISHLWVFPRDTEALAPVIARLAGR
jgi:probable F420-dependent oxidoreductase